jgi:hypothetical protein
MYLYLVLEILLSTWMSSKGLGGVEESELEPSCSDGIPERISSSMSLMKGLSPFSRILFGVLSDFRFEGDNDFS